MVVQEVVAVVAGVARGVEVDEVEEVDVVVVEVAGSEDIEMASTNRWTHSGVESRGRRCFERPLLYYSAGQTHSFILRSITTRGRALEKHDRSESMEPAANGVRAAVCI